MYSYKKDTQRRRHADPKGGGSVRTEAETSSGRKSRNAPEGPRKDPPPEAGTGREPARPWPSDF